jgi:membrane peptidoglycan carboxypeptidase
MKKILFWGLAALALLLLVPAVWVFLSLRDLPDVSVLRHYRPAAASEVLDRNGHLLAHFYDGKFRVWVPIASLPDSVIWSVVIAEDDTFFGHQGINYKAVWEALQHDVQTKRFSRGGSTITQQMIKNVLLSKEKTVKRKIREFVLARRAEEILTKRQILEIYLNEVEWGENIYGIEAASRFYFDKHAPELSHAEAALLAGMLPNPKYYNPFKRPDKARKRQERVLFNMQQAKHITPEEYQQALAEPLRLRDPDSRRFDFSMIDSGRGRPCYQKALEQILLSFFSEQDLYRRGLRIRTMLDKQLQESLIASLATGSVPAGDVPERIIVLKEGTEIRALSCSGSEEQVRTSPVFLETPSLPYEVTTMAPDAIRKEEIVMPAKEEATAGDGE